MPYTMEHNKIVGAVLTAMIVASASGNLARILYPEPEMEEPLVRVEAGGGTQAAEEAPERELSLAERLAQADSDAGAKVAKKCTGCHSFEKGGPHKVGPNLWGVVGREVASVENFAYSDALKAYGGTWTFERLDAFLADPKGTVPGTKMSFTGVKDPRQRANLLVWLARQSDSPPPLPAAETPTPQEEAAAPAEEATPPGRAPAPAEEAAASAEGEGTPATASAEETPTARQAGTQQATAPTAEEAPAQEAAAPAEGRTPTDPVLAMIATADPARGEKIARRCKACHSFEKGGPHKVGPNLWGVVGREVAAVEGFAYSDALKAYGGTWTFERLAAFLRDPRGTVPGTRMAFSGIRKPEDLAALLAWLRTRADEPAPLP